MTTAIVKKPTAFDLALDLEVIQTSLRVTNELMLEQLCNTLINEPDSVTTAHERIYLLLELIPSKLEKMDKLHGALVAMHRESKSRTESK